MGNDLINLNEYISGKIEKIIGGILKSTIKNPKETVFIKKYMFASKKANAIRIRYVNNGQHIPSFLIVSIASSCNLFCKGCYARANNSCGENKNSHQLSADNWEDIFSQAENLGVSFILLTGGEPLLREDVILQAAKHKSIVFPIFTNGTLINEKYLKLFDSNRNLVPVLSIEGDKIHTDERRGTGTYDILYNMMDLLNAKGILYGVSVTVTNTNISHVTDNRFIQTLSAKGCGLVFYVEYVPVDKDTKHLTLVDMERELLSAKQDLLREKYNNILFLSFPGDEKLLGGCLAAGRGFFHINADGSVEPCPFSPYSDTNLNNCTLLDALNSPLFKKLIDSGILLDEHDGGCLLFKKENEVKALI